jgi:hypothetical protein
MILVLPLYRQYISAGTHTVARVLRPFLLWAVALKLLLCHFAQSYTYIFLVLV